MYSLAVVKPRRSHSLMMNVRMERGREMLRVVMLLIRSTFVTELSLAGGVLELANYCQRPRLSYVRLARARKTVCAAVGSPRARQRPVARRTAASDKACAHAAESFAFLPFAACVALAPA